MEKIFSLEETGNEEKAGGKAASLSQLSDITKVPKGFVVTSRTFHSFLEENGIKDKILSILARTQIKDKESIERASRKIFGLFEDSRISEDLKEDIEEAYKDFVISSEAKKAGQKAMELIKAGRGKPPVVVRASPKRDGKLSPGIYGNKLNVKGDENLVEAVKEVWKSFYSPEAIYYREKNGHAHDITFAVLVQKMIDADKTLAYIESNPCNPRQSILEGVRGLGEMLARGEVTPDRYIFDDTGVLEEKSTSSREWKQGKNPSTGNIEKQPLPSSKKNTPLLDRSEARDIRSRVEKIASRFSSQSMVEFCTKNGDIFVLDVSPIQTSRSQDEEEGKEIIKGTGVSPGRASGELTRTATNAQGKVLLENMPSSRSLLFNSPEALVATSGGFSSNGTKMAREMDIPALVVERQETKSIAEGKEVKVDAFRGVVFPPISETRTFESPSPRETEGEGFLGSQSMDSITATKIMTLVDSQNFDPGALEGSQGAVVEIEGRGMEPGLGAPRTETVVERILQAFKGEVWLKTESSEDGVDRALEIMNNAQRSINIILSGSSPERSEPLFSTFPRDVGRGVVVSTPETLLSEKLRKSSDFDLAMIDFKGLVELFFGGEEGGNKVASSEAFWDSIEGFCEYCSKKGAEVSVSGVRDKRFLKRLIESGVDSVLVRPENIGEAKSTVARVEKKLLLERMG
ncbi:MAG: PEP/pyruvate-binding domain-containing protein [Candidatus Aenigmatarchaeota archaeon]